MSTPRTTTEPEMQVITVKCVGYDIDDGCPVWDALSDEVGRFGTVYAYNKADALAEAHILAETELI